MASIICDNVYKRYKDKQVLKGLSFECDSDIVFLAGKNGAGKTTFIRMALGMDKPDNGSIRFFNGTDKRHNIGVVFDTPSLYPHMTCKENIQILCTGFLKDKQHTNEILQNLNIDHDLLHKKVGKCSFGQQHRISVAIALIRKPTFLFLDEPTIGLDPVSWELVRKSIIANKEKQNGCIIITGQDYFEMASFSNKLVVMDQGVAKYVGSTKELLTSFPTSLSLTTFDPLPADLVTQCVNIIENQDGSKIYCFADSLQEDTLLTYVKNNNIAIQNLSFHQVSLKEAVYKIIKSH